jgi:CoA-transferase family III
MTTMRDAIANAMLREIWAALGGDVAKVAGLDFTGTGDLPSVFAVSELAAASVGAAALAAAELIAAGNGGGPPPKVSVDRRLSSMWFSSSIRPQGWKSPPPWDPIAGDYRTSDGWIRLHTNAPHHRDATLAVLKVEANKESVANAVKAWRKTALESAIVAQGGCAAAMRSFEDWAEHPQGEAVAREPLFHVVETDASPPHWTVPRERPLARIRVLDLTRVLAGPTASRFLAGLGADVLRIDPPWWDEPGLVPEMTLGKHCARLDLREPAQRARFEELLSEADVLVLGYRSDALGRLGLDAARRQQIRPGLVDVALDAYGWTGPWRGRRGFDSLVQMSSGIADAGMRLMNREKPTPLPVQALDFALGYCVAAAALRGLTRRLTTGRGCEVRSSLARIAHLLVGQSAAVTCASPLAPEQPDDLSDWEEATVWGPARRLRPPAAIEGAPLAWDRPARPLGSDPAAWNRG